MSIHVCIIKSLHDENQTLLFFGQDIRPCRRTWHDLFIALNVFIGSYAVFAATSKIPHLSRSLDICHHNKTIDRTAAGENTTISRSVLTDRIGRAVPKAQQKLGKFEKDAVACREGTRMWQLASRRLMCFTGW